MIYFTFSFKLTGPVKGIARVGRLFFMIMLGTIFGTNMVTNFGVPVGVAYTIAQTPAIYVMIVAFIIILIDIVIRRRGIRIKSPF